MARNMFAVCINIKPILKKKLIIANIYRWFLCCYNYFRLLYLL